MEDKNLIVPNIGEFKDVEVIEVLVNEGDIINKNDPLITIESDKSSVEIPSLLSGKIQKLNVKIGDKVSEGSLIAIIASDEEKQKTSIRNEGGGMEGLPLLSPFFNRTGPAWTGPVSAAFRGRRKAWGLPPSLHLLGFLK